MRARMSSIDITLSSHSWMCSCVSPLYQPVRTVGGAGSGGKGGTATAGSWALAKDGVSTPSENRARVRVRERRREGREFKADQQGERAAVSSACRGDRVLGAPWSGGGASYFRRWP